MIKLLKCVYHGQMLKKLGKYNFVVIRIELGWGCKIIIRAE